MLPDQSTQLNKNVPSSSVLRSLCERIDVINDISNGTLSLNDVTLCTFCSSDLRRRVKLLLGQYQKKGQSYKKAFHDYHVQNVRKKKSQPERSHLPAALGEQGSPYQMNVDSAEQGHPELMEDLTRMEHILLEDLSKLLQGPPWTRCYNKEQSFA